MKRAATCLLFAAGLTLPTSVFATSSSKQPAERATIGVSTSLGDLLLPVWTLGVDIAPHRQFAIRCAAGGGDMYDEAPFDRLVVAQVRLASRRRQLGV